MAEILPPSAAGYEPRMVHRCYAVTPINPQDPPGDWIKKRCTRPDRHRGRHQLVYKGTEYRW